MFAFLYEKVCVCISLQEGVCAGGQEWASGGVTLYYECLIEDGGSCLRSLCFVLFPRFSLL